MNLFKRLSHFVKNKILDWLEIEDLPDEGELVEEIKDRVLFELSFIDKTALSDQDKSKLYHCQIIYFHKEKEGAFINNRYYRANSQNEAMGAYLKYLESKDITPEIVSCKWVPKVVELDPDCFIDVRDDDDLDED